MCISVCVQLCGCVEGVCTPIFHDVHVHTYMYAYMCTYIDIAVCLYVNVEVINGYVYNCKLNKLYKCLSIYEFGYV